MNKSRHTPTLSPRGFTLLELVVVMAIIAILALMTMPLLYGNTARAQIVDSMPLAKIAQTAVEAYYNGGTKTLPASNETAGLPAADKLVGNYVSSVAVDNGAVTMTFGNNAHAKIKGKKLTFRPMVMRIPNPPLIPGQWLCGNKTPPANMDIGGTNQTDVPIDTLPIGNPPNDCR